MNRRATYRSPYERMRWTFVFTTGILLGIALCSLTVIAVAYAVAFNS